MSQVCVRERKKEYLLLCSQLIGNWPIFLTGDWRLDNGQDKTPQEKTPQEKAPQEKTPHSIKLTCGILYSKENCVELLHNEKSLSAEGK